MKEEVLAYRKFTHSLIYKKHQDTDCSLSTRNRKKALKHLIIRVQWLYERVHLRYDLSIIKVVRSGTPCVTGYADIKTPMLTEMEG